MGLGYTLPLEGKSLVTFIVSAVMLGCSVVAVALRIFVRCRLVKGFGWDDSFMVLALVIFTALNIVVMIGVRKGIGHLSSEFSRPNGTLDLEAIENAMLWWWLGQQLYLWSSAVTKISIAIALLRLTVKKAHRIFLWFIIGVSVVIMIAFWLILLLDCKPISYFWTRVQVLTSTGTCTSVEVLLVVAYIYSSLTIICDLSLGLLPIFLVWKLQMNRKTKIAVGGILSLGAIASVAVIIRMPTLPHYRDYEFLSSTIRIAIWSIIETGLGITAGSLITLRPLFRWLLGDGSVYGKKPSTGGKYPLSSVRSANLKNSANDPSYWRPDLNPDREGHFAQASSLPHHGTHLDMNSSSEALNPVPRTDPSGRGVTVQKTFVHTVSERDHRSWV
ncbi:hypothetical protein POX_a01042 [Penicillium oxalicum]|uniref:Rhodopsin domain-containing protein n=1 Tax=Penicillium oxalicum (strain 114-2 / CGMCC 5302) TaxID=933388 RepID=S7ZYT8_PENO1|nr:hypothetical protein POX_a01042 [Penicillium oxalicum]EPS33971.1 hypothetical protein PDE_08933 [Penicillium oxalicum 114-2]KAI2794443.1 hypothetical protein POX_a01042 [Penicillium oxalicum]